MEEKLVYVWNDGTSYRVVAKGPGSGITSARASESALPYKVRRFVSQGYSLALGQSTDGKSYPLTPEVEDAIRRQLSDA